jgi:hypothetical protein
MFQWVQSLEKIREFRLVQYKKENYIKKKDAAELN